MENTYKIEKNVPLKLRTERHKYPLAKMEVGNSFFIKMENGEKPESKRRSAIQCLARFCEKNEGVKFSTSVIDNGVRIWRIK